jgi:drug/metabolite transporter (DMT)-like permease
MYKKYLQPTTSYGQALLYMHLSVLLWGLTGVLGRGIELNESLLVTYRLLLTSVTLGIHAFWIKKLPLPSRQELLKMAFVGVLITVHWLFFYAAIKFANVSITLSMLASQALFTVFFEWILLKKKVAKSEFIFGIAALVGISIIFKAETVYGLGIFLALMAALVGSLFNVFNKPIVAKHNPVMVSFVEIASGVLFLICLLPFYLSYFNVQKLVPTSFDTIQLVILAFFCTHLTLVLSLKALQTLDAFTLNLSINLEPIYGISLAFFFFNEQAQLSFSFFIGATIILLSVVAHGFWASKKVRLSTS